MRDWRIYADFAQSLIGITRRLYVGESFGVDLKETVYALDASTIDLCLSVFPWAPFRSAKGVIVWPGFQAVYRDGGQFSSLYPPARVLLFVFLRL